MAFSAHQLHTLTHTPFQSYVQLNQLISTQTVFRGEHKELMLLHVSAKEHTQPGSLTEGQAFHYTY